jgi:hypothetical protein
MDDGSGKDRVEGARQRVRLGEVKCDSIRAFGVPGGGDDALSDGQPRQ